MAHHESAIEPDEEYIYAAYRLDAAARDLAAAKRLFDESRVERAGWLTESLGALIAQLDSVRDRANEVMPQTDPKRYAGRDASVIKAVRQLLESSRAECSAEEVARLTAHLADYLDGFRNGLEVQR